MSNTEESILPNIEYEKWFYTARDPKCNSPYGTLLIYQVCEKNDKKFEIAENIMQVAFVAGMQAQKNKLENLIVHYENDLWDLKNPNQLMADMIEPWDITDLQKIIDDLEGLLK